MSIQNITVTITLDTNLVPQFAYNPTGPVLVNETNTHLIYSLIDQTGMGLSFAGAAFDTPFDRIIDAVQVENPNSLILMDTDSYAGQTGFRLIFNNAKNSLLMSSPDPQVINVRV
jgi:hypothetical protein